MSAVRPLAVPSARTVTREVLPNGLVLLVYEKHDAPSVVVSGSVAAGALVEAPAQAGLAAFTSDVLLRGTERYTAEALHDALESIGADIDVNAGRTRAGIGGKALAEDLPTIIDLLAEVLRRPVFPDDHLALVRGEILTELNYAHNDTRYRARRAFEQTLYPAAHPFHHPDDGTPQTVAALVRDDLRAFHAAHYAPSSTILVVVGAVQAGHVRDVVHAAFADWAHDAAAQPLSVPPVPPLTATQRVFVPVPGKTQSDIVLGVAGPSRSAPDYEAARLANSVFGQFGMGGRIGDVVREQQGLAYYCYSQLSGGNGALPWLVSAGVAAANVERAIDSIVAEVRRLVDEPLPAEDLADNQAYFTGHLPLSLESNEGVAGTLLAMEQYDLGLDYLVTYADRVNALTRDDVRATAARYLSPDALAIAVAGPQTS